MVNENTTLLNKNAVLLVSGGAKGITAQCAIKLAETAGCHFILAGRSVMLKTEPEWAAGNESRETLQSSALSFYKEAGKKITPKKLQEEIKAILSSREITATLREIESRGGEAMYISADVTNASVLKKQVEAAIEKFGPVTGVIHGAGNLADKLIENKSARDFDIVVNTKINGLENIIKAITPESLKFIVLFSSVAGFFGNAGQADYAIANEILNKSAYILQKSLPDCRVLAINWGPWDSGMVSDELKKVFEQRNIHLIPTQTGIEALVAELTRPAQDASQVVIGSPIYADIEFTPFEENTLTIQRSLTLKNNPFLNDHRIGPQPVLPATCASAWLADTCQSLNPGFTFVHMQDFKILKGITFDENEHAYNVNLKQLSLSSEARKTYEVTITSQNGSQRKIFHYSAQVTLTKTVPDVRKNPSVLDFHLDPAQQHNGHELYQDGTLFHGPSFQGIQEVLLVDRNKVITKVSLPPMSAADQGQFPARTTNPYINDAIVQSLLIWTQEFYDAPCLPSRLHQWDQYRVVPFGVPVWVTLTVTHHNQHAVVGDILVQDEEGGEYYSFTGLEGTVSSHLKRFIGKKGS